MSNALKRFAVNKKSHPHGWLSFYNIDFFIQVP
jgi:hypothetical protein